jgi:hypothetical protein
MSSKLPYSKPTVTRMGPVVEKTEGGLTLKCMEVLGYRWCPGA